MENEYEYEELFETVQSMLHGIVTFEKDDTAFKITEIFQRIPEKDRDILLYKRNLQLILPERSSVSMFLLNPLVNRDKRYDPFFPVWLVALNSSLLDAPDKEFIYIVAHELAHVFLEHNVPGQPTDTSVHGDAEQGCWGFEIEADEKVIAWGFEEELIGTPNNYIFELCPESKKK